MRKYYFSLLDWKVDYIDDNLLIVAGEGVKYSLEELEYVLGLAKKNKDKALQLHKLKKTFNGIIIDHEAGRKLVSKFDLARL